jgi:hypothetical protein
MIRFSGCLFFLYFLLSELPGSAAGDEGDQPAYDKEEREK